MADSMPANVMPEPDHANAATRLALRPKDAAKALGIGERLLWSWTSQKLIPHVRIGKAILYPVAELERWLSEQATGGSRKHRT